MPRDYIHELGTRVNRNYRHEDLEKPVSEISANKLTYGKAVGKYSVPKSTLMRHVKQKGKLRTYGG